MPTICGNKNTYKKTVFSKQIQEIFISSQYSQILHYLFFCILITQYNFLFFYSSKSVLLSPVLIKLRINHPVVPSILIHIQVLSRQLERDFEIIKTVIIAFLLFVSKRENIEILYNKKAIAYFVTFTISEKKSALNY